MGGIYMPTAFLEKTSSGALRTIQKVRCFVLFWRPRVPTGLGPDGQNPTIHRFSALGGLREKKVFCPGNILTRYCAGTSRINYCPAKQIRPAGNNSGSSRAKWRLSQQGESHRTRDQE